MMARLFSGIEMTMYNTVAVANSFIARALSEQAPDLSPPKLHELVYLAHGWYIGKSGEPLIAGQVAAFRDGVLVPELREQGCWGTRRIDAPISLFTPDAEGNMKSTAPRLNETAPLRSLLDWVWQTFGALTSFELSSLVREADGPWDKVWHHPSRTSEEPYDIPFELLKKWFTAEVLLNQARGKIEPGQSQVDRETTQRFERPPSSDDLRPV